MKKSNFLTLHPVVAGLLLLGCAAASASSVTISGADASFTFDDSLLGLYGTPMVAGNSIFFSPVDFKAVSTNDAGTTVTSSAVNVVVTPNQGVTLGALGLKERGDYMLTGDSSYVNVGGQLSVFDTANPITGGYSTSTADTSDLTLNNHMQSWNAGTSIDLTGDQWKNTDSFNVTLDNILGATTVGNASEAYINKTFAGLFVTTTDSKLGGSTGSNGEGSDPPATVPLPGTVGLFSSGLVWLAGTMRSKKRPS